MPLILPPHTYDAIWVQAEHFKVEFHLIAAICAVESTFRRNAVGDSHKSFGIMQVHVDYAGAGHHPEELLDLDRNLEIGVEYLRNCLLAFPGDRRRGVAAYNCGITGARRDGWEVVAGVYADKVLELAARFVAMGIVRTPWNRSPAD